MINLIPPAAKHNLKKEYISRVATVWSWLGAFSIAVGVALLLPTLLFISLQYKALTADSNTAREMKESLVEAEALIEDTTILAKHLNQASESRSFLFYNLNKNLSSFFSICFRLYLILFIGSSFPKNINH